MKEHFVTSELLLLVTLTTFSSPRQLELHYCTGKGHSQDIWVWWKGHFTVIMSTGLFLL